MGFNPNEEDNPDRFYVENALINVKLGYEVVDTNMELIDEQKNIYSYHFQENDEDFKILINYDLSKKFNPHKKNMLYIIIAVLVIIVTWVTLFFVNRKKKI